MWSEAHLKATTVSFDQAISAVEVRADDMMPNADVRLAHSGKTLDVVTALPSAALIAPNNVV
jgi:hypothetical protein